MRTIVDLPEDQIEKLDQARQTSGISRAEAIRRAVEQYLSVHLPGDRDEAFGIWKNRGVGSPDYERKLREEWER
ncbi:MAG: CopG family transcriptional regulator [Candidatus Omnitrophica bacterium]|nr:CopG family transcriptional regulator [Candidatus Omnitrophota bacterium]MCB9784998.1 CopG family transcriptional regulator [Candidatus Omnitrophota bacterium]